MRQRAMIAMAIANAPALLVADEPTTALDVTIQAQILEVLRVATQDLGAATVLVTHDLGVVAQTADRVVVMAEGTVVETAPVEQLFGSPAHQETIALLAAVPGRQTAVTAGHAPRRQPRLCWRWTIWWCTTRGGPARWCTPSTV